LRIGINTFHCVNYFNCVRISNLLNYIFSFSLRVSVIETVYDIICTTLNTFYANDIFFVLCLYIPPLMPYLNTSDSPNMQVEELRSSRILSNVWWKIITGVLGKPIAPIFSGQAILDFLILEDGNDRLSRNAGIELPT